MDKNRVVIITGGARGIGLGTAECFADNGDIVVIADLNAEQSGLSAERLKERGATDAAGIECDVSRRESVEAMIAEVIRRFSRIDVLVNNAGICPFQPIMEMSPGTWQKSLDVNLTGAFHCTQAAATHMIERGAGGRVVFITSLADHRTNANQVDYAASKGGLKLAMVGFAAALGPKGVNCNAVAPGHVSTAMTCKFWESEAGKKRAKEIIPLGRTGTTREIGEAVFFLASPQASYINGITLRVDGGNSAVA